MKKIEIISSFDDGGELDLALGDLLLKYDIPAIFYIPANCELTEEQIGALAGRGSCPNCKKARKLFGFGAHTMSHPEDLKRLPGHEVVKEIAGSKAFLENIIKRPITKFCYPSGKFDDRIKEIVKTCGFKEARTTKVLNIKFPKDRFETNPTIHIHPDRKEYGDKTWMDIAPELLDKVIREGGRFEIWGHSFELEQYNMWEFLEDFLSYMNDEMKKINYKRGI